VCAYVQVQCKRASTLGRGHVPAFLQSTPFVHVCVYALQNCWPCAGRGARQQCSAQLNSGLGDGVCWRPSFGCSCSQSVDGCAQVYDPSNRPRNTHIHASPWHMGQRMGFVPSAVEIVRCGQAGQGRSSRGTWHIAAAHICSGARQPPACHALQPDMCACAVCVRASQRGCCAPNSQIDAPCSKVPWPHTQAHLATAAAAHQRHCGARAHCQVEVTEDLRAWLRQTRAHACVHVPGCSVAAFDQDFAQVRPWVTRAAAGTVQALLAARP